MHTAIERFKAIVRAFSPNERRAFFGAAALALVGGAVAFGFLIGAVTKVIPAQGGEFIEGMLGQPKFINPVLAASEVDKGLVRLLFSNIYDLAETVKNSKDARLWQVRLKENLTWQDGAKLTSNDVVYTVQKIQEPESNSPLFSSWQGVAVRRVSEREVEFNLSAPYAFFDVNLKNLYIIPKHIFGNVPSPNWVISEFRLTPVGNGPYKVRGRDTEPNGFITAYHLTANPTYFGTPPLIPNLHFKFFSTKDEIQFAFNAGYIGGTANMEYTNLASIKRPYEVSELTLPSYYAVFMNQGQRLALKESAVRRALDLAIPKQELVQSVLGGRARLIKTPVYTWDEREMFLSAEEEAQKTPEELLEEAGWKLAEDGVREKEIKGSTLRLEFELVVPDTGFLVKTADFLKNAWRKIGAKVIVLALPLEEVKASIIKNREYQLLLFGNILSANLDLFPFWHSSERFYPGSNLAIYSNKKVDQLLESIRQNPDPESRKGQTNEVRDLIRKDAPAIFLYAPAYLYVATNDLKGVGTSLIGEPADRFLGLKNWHLKTARVLR